MGLFAEIKMRSSQLVIITFVVVILIGGVIFLAQAIEPPRDIAVEILDNEQFAR